MFDGKLIGEGISNLIKGVIIIFSVLVLIIVGLIFFNGSDEDENQVTTEEKIEPSSIEITNEGDTLYHYEIQR